jgi:hypothetical protein
MIRPFRTFLCILAASCIVACSSGAPQDNGAFPQAPLTTVTGDSSKLRVEMRSAPDQPLTAGLGSIELRVTDAETGAPVEGLDVTLTPWMPAMGHGTSVVPQLVSADKGRYVFDNVSLFMPGEWQLRTHFAGAVADSVEPVFSVP